MKYSKMVEMALEMLKDDDLFVEMVNELDSWNGFTDGFRAAYRRDNMRMF